MNKIIKKIIEIRNYLIYKRFDFLSKIDKSKLRVNEQADFVVSIASYPKRIHLLPSVFQALNNQTAVPKKWILVATFLNPNSAFKKQSTTICLIKI